MREMLYTRQDEVYAATDLSTTLGSFAQDLGLDTAMFADCMQTHKHLAAVEADHRAATDDGVRSRPVFDVLPSDQRLIGAQPLRVFQQLLDAAAGN